MFYMDNYSSEIAPTGHVPAQAPQLMHVLESISNFPSPSEIALTGQPPAQDPQEMQESEITNAITLTSLLCMSTNVILIHFLRCYKSNFCKRIFI